MEYFIPVKPYSLLLLNYPTCEILVLNSTGYVEPHIKESSHIRDFVFGFGDGINTSLVIVAGVGGANSSADFIILDALVGMFTGSKAMAVQNYLAIKSQREILESEIEEMNTKWKHILKKNEWKLKNFIDLKTLMKI